MGTISRFAKGFLDLVGANSLGENPRQYSDVVVPTADIGEQYLVGVQETAFANTNVAVAGFNPYLTNELVVPTGEVWKVLAYGVNVVTAAGMTGRFGPAVRIGATGANFPLGDPALYVASETNWKFWGMQGFWAPAGYVFGASLAQVVGGSPTVVQGAMVFSRLRA